MRSASAFALDASLNGGQMIVDRIDHFFSGRIHFGALLVFGALNLGLRVEFGANLLLGDLLLPCLLGPALLISLLFAH